MKGLKLSRIAFISQANTLITTGKKHNDFSGGNALKSGMKSQFLPLEVFSDHIRLIR